jgi:hypothetical protein
MRWGQHEIDCGCLGFLTLYGIGHLVRLDKHGSIWDAAFLRRIRVVSSRTVCGQCMRGISEWRRALHVAFFARCRIHDARTKPFPSLTDPHGRCRDLSARLATLLCIQILASVHADSTTFLFGRARGLLVAFCGFCGGFFLLRHAMPRAS